MAVFKPRNQLNLYYETYGKSENPAVMLIHGRGGNATIWWRQVHQLSEKFYVIAIDLRGFGRTECEKPVRFSKTAWTEDLCELIEHLNSKSVTLVSHSLGGLAAITTTLQIPAKINGVILNGNAGGVFHPELEKLKNELFERMKNIPITLKSFGPGYIEKNRELHTLYCSIRNFNPVTDDKILNEITPKADVDIELLRTIECPILLMRGEHDGYISNEMFSFMKKYIKNCETQIMSGSGHSTYYEDPEGFNRIVSDFVLRNAKK